jgi:hypothetical protein
MPRFKRRHDAALVSSYLRQLQTPAKPPADPPKKPVAKSRPVSAVSVPRP